MQSPGSFPSLDAVATRAVLHRLVLSLCIALLIAWPSAILASSPTSYDHSIIRPHFVDIGGRRLNVVCVGKGSPVVVFMQGGEGSILNWQKVEGPIAAVTRVCFYDRAGFGYSDPPAGPVTAFSETDDLHVLIAKTGIRTPVVLVGHSVGGFYATVYADRFGADVAGLVLVDPGIAGQTGFMTPQKLKVDMENSHRGEDHLLECAALAKKGQMSLEKTRGCIGFPPANAPEERAYLSYMVTHPFWYEAEVSQSRNYFFGGDGGPSLDTQQELSVRRSFGDMPIRVLTRSQPDRAAWWDGADVAAFEEAWKAGHDQLAARSTRGRSIVVPGAGHFIQLDQPDTVVAAIKEVIADTRAAGGAARR